MNIDVVLLPAQLAVGSLAARTVVVLDVLRATTSIAAALSVGVVSIRAFADLDQAKAAAEAQSPRPILSGELHTLVAPGFDLGNSPRQFTAEYAGRSMFLATTNGTKALDAARSAGALFTGSLVNSTATARAAADAGRDVLLLCSGTAGQVSMEDLIGAGAICDTLIRLGYETASDTARIARRLFLGVRDNLPAVLRETQGGRNIIAAGLEPDIDFAARLDSLPIVCAVDGRELLITAAGGAAARLS
jgi:2-phosphosulfolactate phosphatase